MKNKVLKASDCSCVNCETMGIKKKAKVFVGLNDLDAEYKTPLCKECADEWRMELLILLTEEDEYEK